MKDPSRFYSCLFLFFHSLWSFFWFFFLFFWAGGEPLCEQSGYLALWGAGTNVSRCEIEGCGGWGGVSQLKQDVYYFSSTPPSTSCRKQEPRLNGFCCCSMVPLAVCQDVPGWPETMGPLLAFGPGSVLLQWTPRSHGILGQSDSQRPLILIWRNCLAVSQITHIKSS